jgi:glutaredoxin
MIWRKYARGFPKKMTAANKHQTTHQVLFYTKAGCHLCDEAREVLEDLAAEVSFELTERDIRTDLSLFEAYRYRIPVIIIDGTITLEGRISPREVQRALNTGQE